MRPLIASFALTLLVATLTAGQDHKTFTVGNATAARGQKVTGTIEVPPGVDAGLSVPVGVDFALELFQMVLSPAQLCPGVLQTGLLQSANSELCCQHHRHSCASAEG